jgi:outer membrane protein OmpA-like peptidoglycan-associated protein
VDEVCRAIAAGAGSAAEAKTIGARLDRIEAQLVKAASAIVRVQFDTAATEFTPSAEIARALVPARAAERVNVRGRTDARVAGAADPRIALARALAARKYLVEQGVDGNKIRVFALPAGDFIAPVGTVEGRALNRRVEIELVNRRYAELRNQAAGLQGSQP